MTKKIIKTMSICLLLLSFLTARPYYRRHGCYGGRCYGRYYRDDGGAIAAGTLAGIGGLIGMGIASSEARKEREAYRSQQRRIAELEAEIDELEEKNQEDD